MTRSLTTFKPMKDKIVWKMGVLCVLGFGGFMLWGSIAPLEEGVAASGQIVVEDNRQMVQHLEGGIVSEIKVREGERVKKGDILVVLEKTASLSNRDQVVQEYGALAASAARLKALQLGATQVSFSILDTLNLGDSERAEIISRETSLFHQQRNALSADIAVLSARINAAKQTQTSRKEQIVIAQKALVSAQGELAVIQDMFSQQLARRDQVTSSERAQENAANLLSTSADLLAAEERLNAAQDILDRSVIFAPVSGEVLNMAFSTIGGVVRSGETLMEIVPNIGEVTASVQIAATDRSSVFEGQLVRTQFSSYKGWQAPRLEGEIIDVSADLKTDPVTAVSYYEARIRVPASEIAKTTNVDILPGMPVDAFIYSGKSRTMLDYLLEPLGESLFRGLRTS